MINKLLIVNENGIKPVILITPNKINKKYNCGKQFCRANGNETSIKAFNINNNLEITQDNKFKAFILYNAPKIERIIRIIKNI